MADLEEGIDKILDKVSYGRLLDLSRSLSLGQVVPYVGAGMSLFAGYPSWPQLCEEVKQEASRSGTVLRPRRSREFAKLLEHYSSGAWLDDFIMHRFAAKAANLAGASNSPLRKLPLLPLSIVVTTNYDSLLENFFDSAVESTYTGATIDPNIYYQLVKPIDRKKSSVTIIKLHGSAELRNGLVATYEQYRLAYQEPGHNRHLLRNLMASQTMLFLGCSLEKQDPPMQILAQLKEEQRKFARNHYVLRRTSDLRHDEQVLSTLGVKAIYYRDDHDTSISAILSFLASRVTEPLNATALTVTMRGAIFPLQVIADADELDNHGSAEWNSLIRRVRSRKVAKDLQIDIDPSAKTLRLTCITGSLRKLHNKEISIPISRPSRPEVYLFPPGFEKETIRSLEVVFDHREGSLIVISSGVVRVRFKIADDRLIG